MALIVQKYGGTSVGSIERMLQVAKLVKKAKSQGDSVVVVVSAMSGTTDSIVRLIQELQGQASHPESDVALSTGETLSAALVALALESSGMKARSVQGWQIALKTDVSYGKARIKTIDTEFLGQLIKQNIIPVVTGFQGIDGDGRVTTLGRGGSDTSAVAIAAALQADECQIYTDVDGVYTTDPRIEPKAKKLSNITIEEMLELASLGSKVLQIRSVEMAGRYKVPLRVLSSFSSDTQGTFITYEENSMMEVPAVSGIALARNEAMVTVNSVQDTPGVAANLVGLVAGKGIVIDMIVQNISHNGLANFSFTVDRSDLALAQQTLQAEIQKSPHASLSINDKVVKVSVVGVGMRSQAGVAHTAFATLAKNGINIISIATSEIKISVLIEEKYAELAVREMHAVFELDKLK